MKTTIIKFSFTAFLFIGFVCLTSCREEENEEDIIFDECCLPEPTDTLYMSQELKSYFYFPVGSWWVYERTDTIAGIYDTARVVRIINEIFYNEFAPYAWEKITALVEHTYYSSPPNSVSPNLEVSFLNLNTLVDRLNITSSSTFLGGLDCVISTPIDSIHIKSLQCSSWSNLDSVSNLSLAGSNFDSVLNISYGRNPITNYISMVSGVGILKYETTQMGHSWKLVNYHIN